MRIVFMGTPDFAAASLKKLLDERFEVVGVFTQPDKPKGRGMELQYSPVKEVALAAGLPVFQPEKMRDGAAFRQIETLNPDILVVVAYGRILPDDILALPKYGAVNVHGSLLPKYRGAAPIQAAVLNGDEVTGVTTMYLAHDMDAGDIIYTAETPVGEFETSGELFDRLMVMGAELLVRTLRAIEDGTAPRTPQDHSKASYVRMLDKSLSSRSAACSRGLSRRWSLKARSRASLPPRIRHITPRLPPARSSPPARKGSRSPAGTGRRCSLLSCRRPAKSA